MAKLTSNFWGVVLILDHSETEDVCDVANTVADITYKLGDALDDGDLALVGFVLEAIAVGISVNVIIVKECDKGNGVYITSPWPTLGTIIPSTRPTAIGLSSGWPTRGSGTFSTEDAADIISFEVQRDVIGSEAVEFELRAFSSSMWRKTLVLRDGLGGQWDISIDPSQGTFTARNGLWSDQVHNGQNLSLWKAKQLGLSTWVLDFAGLGFLPPGSRTIFTWWAD